MNHSNRQIRDLVDFYLRPAGQKSNIFEVWEDGGAFGDSITPSTYSITYRDWMMKKLLSELQKCSPGSLLSLGCGNAIIESQVARAGYPVLGVDAMQEAVDLAQAKGVKALRVDVTEWDPEEPWSVVYMDGLLGHLYQPETGLWQILSRVHSWLSSLDFASIVASNDAPLNGTLAQPAPGVNGFHWLSAEYLRDQAREAGFVDVSVDKFLYKRPLSGERMRSIVVAHVVKQ
jgi:SAM-dependent methyltransferase